MLNLNWEELKKRFVPLLKLFDDDDDDDDVRLFKLYLTPSMRLKEHKHDILSHFVRIQNYL